MNEARDLAAGLARIAEAVCRELLPEGKREGRTWRAPSISGTSRSSVCVELAGARQGVWIDHAAPDDCGDMLDLVAAVRYRGSLREAIAWARPRLGLDASTPPPAPNPVDKARAEHAAAMEAADKRAAAKRVWLAAEPKLAGTPAAAYLAARGVGLDQLGRQPRALRFHPGLHCTEADARLPALVAAITGADGGHQGTHRTWLAQDDAGVWRKAPLAMPKKVLGAQRGGVVPIWRGAGGRALRDAAPQSAVALAEGIETALSVAIACPELRVLCAISVGNLAAIDLPPAIETVVICADHDPEGSIAAEWVQRAAARFGSQGRRVRIAMPDVQGADWNDVLVAA